MSAISSERPFFPPSLKGQGGSSALNAGRALKEAQAAFFRPVNAAVQAPEAQEAQQVAEPVSSTPKILRPGSYLDIRV